MVYLSILTNLSYVYIFDFKTELTVKVTYDNIRGHIVLRKKLSAMKAADTLRFIFFF